MPPYSCEGLVLAEPGSVHRQLIQTDPLDVVCQMLVACLEAPRESHRCCLTESSTYEPHRLIVLFAVPFQKVHLAPDVIVVLREVAGQHGTILEGAAIGAFAIQEADTNCNSIVGSS